MIKQLKSITSVLLTLILFYVIASNFTSVYKVGKDFGKTIEEALSN